MMFRCVLFAVVVSALAMPAAAQVSVGDSQVVVTTGSAVLKRAPDQAWVSIAAERRASTPAEAQQLAASAMTAAQDRRPDCRFANRRPRRKRADSIRAA
jgi:uncharacterized protein YggE